MNKQSRQTQKSSLVVFFLVLWVSGQRALAESRTWNLDKDKTQALPAG